MDHTYKLNSYVCKGGCGAKVEPKVLNRVLLGLPKMPPELCQNLIVGFDTGDDACVYKLDEEKAIIQTVDFFPPVVDDPYLFGAIAATNAISDIYAMGGEPIMAVNLLTFPAALNAEAVNLILKGGYDVAINAKVVLGGGHSIEDKEPKYGMAVTGVIKPDCIWKNSTAKVGDSIVLTKKLGVGMYVLAMRAGEGDIDFFTEADENTVINQMLRLNKEAAFQARNYGINACTDVTGFGFLGHALEMAKGSKVCINIDYEQLPLLEKSRTLADMGIVPAAVYSNRKLITEEEVIFKGNLNQADIDILCCPETSGGLMFSMACEDAVNYVEKMKSVGEEAYIVGTVTEYNSNGYLCINGG